jgi:lipopolysaccharide/colanic/teichoic acid biosynthesis glycosyltransferase
MARSVKLLTPAFTLVALFAIAGYHAAEIGHYWLSNVPSRRHHLDVVIEWMIVLLVVTWTTTYAAGINERGLNGGTRFTRSAGGVGAALIISMALQLVLTRKIQLPLFDLGLGLVILVPGLAIVAGVADRSLVSRGQQERVIALVSDEDKERLVRDLTRAPERPSQLVLAIHPDDPLPRPDEPAPLEDLIREHRPTLVVLNRDAFSIDEIVSQVASAHSRGIRIRTLSLFYDEWLGKLPISELERIALLFDISELHRPVYARVKRGLDVAIALVGLLLTAVLTPFVLLGDLAGNRGSLFYSQQRVGKGGVEFRIHKFRTMKPHNAATTWTSTDDPRVASVGRILRKLHIDELPQFWNVLRREMSIVGPRPEQPHYVAQLRQTIPFYDTRHLVRPGMTGWAQVKYDYGATELDALEKLQYEFYYLRHQDLALDLRIIGRTLRSMGGGGGR